MIKIKERKPLFVGFKLGIQTILLTACISPLLVFVHLYILAIERNASPSGILYELYCFGGPVMILLWFSLPYLLGCLLLTFFASRFQATSTRHLVSAITGMIAGFLGIWSMANSFWGSSWPEFRVSNLVLVGMMEIWSIAIFVWVENRVHRFSLANDKETPVQS